MGRAKPVILDTRNFEKQGDAEVFFIEMLRRYEPGDRVREEESPDLFALLERHTEYVQKVGGGVSHFSVMKTEHGTRCFRIERIDGSGTDFSFYHCIKQRAPTRKQEVSQALRRAVRFDIYDARDNFLTEHANVDGRVQCAETAEWITKDELHLDHRAPLTFDLIVTRFLAENGLTFDEIPITTGTNEQVSTEITDEAVRERFRAYHAAVAELDPVKNTINLSRRTDNRPHEPCIKLRRLSK